MARTCVAFVTLLCAILCIVEKTFSFNFETRLPVIKEGPENSYFGFSVAEHRTTNAVAVEPFVDSVLIVGAPIYQTNIGAKKPGGVFRCPFSSNYSDCSLLELDDPALVNPNHIKDNQWLGVSVTSQGPGGAVAACAHRYKEQPVSRNEIHGYGKCYLMESDFTKDVFSPDGYNPCYGASTPDGYTGSGYYYCQAGTDVTVSRPGVYEDKTFSEFILGMPGTGDWTGGIDTTPIPNQQRNSQSRTGLDDPNIGVDRNSYLGFSVASGKLKDGSARVFIAGAPRYKAKGAVVILESANDMSPTLVYRIDAEKPSSSFGYDIATADLNGDGYDDLIVGAPQFYDRLSLAGGRVYIYENVARDGTFEGVEPIKLTGPQDSLFGIAIANIGDINIDKLQDIAIGAPYENDGQGAVYIYLGDKTQLILQPQVQKITPIDLPTGLSYPMPNATFGYAVAGAVDLDGNGFPEITVGAYETESIVVLRGRPVIKIEEAQDLTAIPQKLDFNTTNCKWSSKDALCFNVTFCLSYFCGSDTFDDPIVLDYNMTIEHVRRSINLHSRAVFRENGNYLVEGQLTLPPQSLESNVCSPDYEVIIKPGIIDIFRPIPIMVKFSIPEREAVMPEVGAPLPSLTPFPILDSSTLTTLSTEVQFEKECEKDEDRECTSNLVVQASVDIEGTPPVLKVGIRKEKIRLSVSIANLDEDAYDAKLQVTHPLYLDYYDFITGSEQVRCSSITQPPDANNSLIECSLGNRYYYAGGSRDSFEILFDIDNVPADAEEFTIAINTSLTNTETNPEDNSQVITVEVESVTDILIDGNGPEQIVFSGQVRGESAMRFFEDVGPPVNQEWTIFNEGPGAVNTALVTIKFPIEVENGKWLLYMTEMPYVGMDKGNCNVTPEYYVNELDLVTKDYLVENRQNPPYVVVGGESPTGAGANTPAPTRKKRSLTPEPISETAETTRGKDITLNCDDGSANCVTIMCDLVPMKARDEIIIYIKSRLWNSTFLEDYRYVKSVKVFTEGNVQIESAPYITQPKITNDHDKLNMTVYPDIEDIARAEPIKWWIIVLAVICGLILLIILIIILWKCGFFSRPGSSGGGPCGFFERKTGYKYATVTQQTTTGKGKKEKTGYYDDMYYS